jgi:o-succinylbenzoate synthase
MDFSAHRLNLTFEAKTLLFKRPSGTSRGILTEKKLWIFTLTNEQTGLSGIGECSIIPGLSPDYTSDEQYTSKLTEVCINPIHFFENKQALAEFPSILFGLESAFIDLKNGGKQRYFESDFTQNNQPIPINGLIWMGDEAFMNEQIEEKLNAGFSYIKMKVGAIDFEAEFAILNQLRKRFPADQLVIRVDANGAFTPDEAPEKLKRLATLDIHSIEQAIAAGQIEQMRDLCAKNILPIALDEELIGVHELEKKKTLLQTINPHYIILKPSLHGGISGTKEWIACADELGIPWWITSALESNIGLMVIAQFTGQYHPTLPQGLGTGGLYETNFKTSLRISEGNLYYL